jgi:hypothetical protein
MLQRIHRRLGTAGMVVAMIALIATLGGTALAASGALTGKQKKEVEKIAKKYAGKPGATGATGAAGVNGSPGEKGANGAVGPAGPTGATGPAGPTGAKGSAGPAGPTGTYGGIDLPAGVTETGYWSFNTPGAKTIEDGSGNMVTVGSSKVWVSISFTDPVENEGEFAVSVTGDPDFDEVCGTGPNGAGGTPTSPEAPSKRLCIYIFSLDESNATFDNVAGHPINIEESFRSLKQTGAVMQFSTTVEGPAKAAGTWAVTG